MKRFVVGCVASLVIALSCVNVVQACPACKDGYAAGSKQAAIGEAYSISVLFMLSMPLTILSVAGVVYVRHMKKIRKK